MTIIKKWKAGRGEQIGVVQVKLKKSGSGVDLVAVDEYGGTLEQGNILSFVGTGVVLSFNFGVDGVVDSDGYVGFKKEDW